jgi:putative chitinase
MGNGDETSGDGWKFIGRGLIQLTGRNNYQAFAKSINKTLDETILYLQTFDGAVESACWFWNTNNINQWVDVGDIVTMTRRINGGTHGLLDRQSKYSSMLELFKPA